jgi:hypothetical protein
MTIKPEARINRSLNKNSILGRRIFVVFDGVLIMIIDSAS